MSYENQNASFTQKMVDPYKRPDHPQEPVDPNVTAIIARCEELTAENLYWRNAYDEYQEGR